ncbi:hypothetical protein PISMIDRAFT_675675 [Pisolithus microcarpus 441]|uniref:Uncharacterized protein n=1 Tax=Pisolithus microcarpus 441 TaxID=765257 RepID=A0A0C9YNV7_9AGAM|nr:hypothetical protein BKA83DRAFT_675675 [Pisolithus microcarpus]KIK26745.1 hypothetical protein PISMIDRAFT_675675 [Pisolithus microcarpus 441]
MNSPEASSPVSSGSSASTPPPDDFQSPVNNRDQQRILTAVNTQQLTTGPMQSPTGSSKRRLPVGSSHEGPSLRDAKSRRREDAASGSRRHTTDNQGQQHPSATPGPSGQVRGDYISRRDKEDLVDTGLVEQLRKEFGDPLIDAFGLKH